MKHGILFSLIILFAVGCKNHSVAISEATVMKADTATFKALFKELNFDSLRLVSNYDSFENKNYFLSGVPLDTIYSSLFPDTIRQYGISFNPGLDQQFAVGRFALDQYHDGYLIRHHGEYNASRITLVIYDKKQGRFTAEHIMLAENWGDDGDLTEISSILTRHDNRLDIAMHINGSSHEPSDSTFNTLIQGETNEVYKLERGHLSKLSETVLKLDTVRMGGYDGPAPVADSTSAQK